jgi:hypothetical protein
MNHLYTTLLLLTLAYPLLSQDGSDIMYYPADKIHSGLEGKTAYIDFYRWSYRGRHTLPDTVTLRIEEKALKFVEHRRDDGFNNWFAEQYLEHVQDSAAGMVIHVEKFSIEKVHRKYIAAKAHLKFYHKNETVPSTKEIMYTFDRKIIGGLLVQAR